MVFWPIHVVFGNGYTAVFLLDRSVFLFSAESLLCSSFFFSVCLMASWIWILSSAREACRSLLPCGSLWPPGILYVTLMEWFFCPVTLRNRGAELLLFVHYLADGHQSLHKYFSSLVSIKNFWWRHGSFQNQAWWSPDSDWDDPGLCSFCEAELLNSHQIYTTKTIETPESNYVLKWTENPGGSHIFPGMMFTPA